MIPAIELLSPDVPTILITLTAGRGLVEPL